VRPDVPVTTPSDLSPDAADRLLQAPRPDDPALVVLTIEA